MPYLLLILSWASYIPQSAALSCASCALAECQIVHCPMTGYAMDPCNCCAVCAKAVGDTCGGLWNLHGSCDLGLYCNTSRLPWVDSIRKEEPGVCKECDSVLYSGCSLVGGVCQCGDSCTSAFDFSNHESCIKAKEQAISCSTVKCPLDVTNLSCPMDSYKAPELSSSDGCCQLRSRCKCRGECSPPPICHDHEYLVELIRGTGEPGTCCSTYMCSNVSAVDCELENSTYNHGQLIQLDVCRTCSCEAGVFLCQHTRCEMPSCGWMVLVPGECCPKCQGCVSANTGEHHANGESWDEGDACTKCQCVLGQSHCTATACARSCKNPRKVPGQCCPLCDDADIVYDPSFTTALGPPCKDNSKCPTDCLNKVVTDVNGCRICACQDSPPMCSDSVGCTKHCAHGFKMDVSEGCYKCRCSRCPRLKCSLKCTYGYAVDTDGCNTCKCKEIGEHANSCFSAESMTYSSGDFWFDGCRECFCENGREMCSLLRCPPLTCSQPIVRPGDCCPSCPNVSLAVSVVNVSLSCSAADGKQHADGELWQLDPCTVCLCYKGQALCETERCPPTLCSHPSKRPGKCCAECTDQRDSSVVPINPRYETSCRTVYNAEYSHGDIWKASECQSCTCRHGHITCYAQVCPSLLCKTTALKKGQCCSQCIADQLYERVCLHGDKWFNHLDTWVEGSSQCTCYHGYAKCESVECSSCEPADRDCCQRGKDGSTGKSISLAVGLPMIIILSVLLLVFAIAVVLLTIVLVKKRQKKKTQLTAIPRILEMRAINNAHDALMKRRPKSTNLEFLHATTENKYNNVLSRDVDCFKPLVDSRNSDNEYIHC